MALPTTDRIISKIPSRHVRLLGPLESVALVRAIRRSLAVLTPPLPASAFVVIHRFRDERLESAQLGDGCAPSAAAGGANLDDIAGGDANAELRG